MVGLAKELAKMINNNDIEYFGKILHEGWLLKKSLVDNISNNKINEYYNAGITAGAEGGKILGSGGGGFILFYCKEEKQNSLRKAMSGLNELEFNFSTTGSEIVYND